MIAPNVRIISFGAGVQTTALAILTAQGKIKNPADRMIFADTGDEKPETYTYLRDIFKPWAETNGLPLIVVNRDGDTLYKYAWRYQMVPSIMRRWCTNKFKIVPLNKYARIIGTRQSPVEMQIGISAEEANRAVDQRPRLYIKRRWPLVEMGITREDCKRIILAEGLPVPPKSGCWYCPFQRLNQWRTLDALHPELASKALALEDHARERNPKDWLGAHKPLRALIGDGRQLGMDELLENDQGCTSGACFV